MDVAIRDPESIAAGVGRNAGWMLVGQMAALSSGLVAVVVVSRVLGATDLGRYRLAQAALSYLVVLADWGLSQLAVREIARVSSLAMRTYGTPVAALRAIFAVLAILGTALALHLTGASPDQASLVLAFSLTLVPTGLALFHVLIGREEIGQLTRARTVAQLAATAIGVAMLVATRSLFSLALAALAASIGSSLWAALYVRRHHGLSWRIPRPSEAMTLVTRGSPFLLAGLAIQVIFNADAFIIQATWGDTYLGRYAGPYAVAGYSLVLGGAVVGAAYPRMSALSAQVDKDRLLRLVTGVMGAIALPVAVGGVLVSEPLVVWLFGPEFAGLGLVFAVLLTLPLVGFYNMTLGQYLTAADAQRSAMAVALLAAAVNVGVNLIVIQTLGIMGAALTVTLTELVTALAYSVLVWRRRRVVVVAAYLAAAPPTVAMALIVAAARLTLGLHVVLLMALGAVVYLVVFAVAPTPGLRPIRDSIRTLLTSPGNS